MAQENQPRNENTEIEPLSDEALEQAAGGGEVPRDQAGSCSWSICSSSA